MKTRPFSLSSSNASRLLGALAFAAVVGATPVANAVPRQLTVQGYLSDTAGTPVTGDYTLLLSLYPSKTAPTSFWDESHTLSVVEGIFDAALGADVGNPLTVEDFSTHDEVWLGVTVLDGPGVPVGGESEIPRKRLSATSYAFVAGYAMSADTANHATTADTATSATSATTAASATSAQGLTCTGCVNIAHLGFDPATQAELQAALSALHIPTSVGGLTGGTISSAVTVQGSVTASSYALSGGGTLCTSSGNCGKTLAQLACTPPASVPKFVSGNWICADISGGSAATANDLTCSGCVSESELDFDPVTAPELTATLAGYVSSASLGTTLAGYVTSTSLNSTLAGYVTNASLTATLGTYVTSSSLATQLADYVKSSALTSTLASYVTSTALTTTLGNYALSSALADYVTTTSLNAKLADYLKTADLAISLAPYVKATDLATTLANYVTGTGLATALGSYAKTADLAAYAKTADLADVARISDLPTSVDGMAGGTVTSALTVQGALAAGSITQNGNAVCDTSGNCGKTLGDFDPASCENDQVLSWTGAGWACANAAAGSGPDQPCIGAFKALQYDGSQWSCIDVRTTGLSVGHANGFEVIDDWGYAWDGIQRGAKTYTQAKDLCESLGGRLPLATELWRNNATTGTGNLGDVINTSYLWTQVPYNAGTEYYTFRISDGASSHSPDAAATKNAFRCVWPDESPDAFTGDNCHGAPGAACQAYGLVWNVDTMDRAPLFWNAAQYECNFSHGSLLESYQFHDLAQTGWANPTGNYLWSSDISDWYQDYYGFGLYRFQAASRVNWQADDADAYTVSPNYSWTYAENYGGTYNFRCIGKKSTSIGKLPASPGCNGGCFSLATTGRRMLFDSANRDALTHANAAETCRLLGASLPTSNEFTEAVHNGWTGNDNSPLWLDEAVYHYGGRYYYPVTGRFDSRETQTDLGFKPGWRWSPEGNTNSRRYTFQTQGEDNLYKFRCVWRETIESAFKTCGANQNQVWSGTAYECEDAVNGTSDGNAIPNGLQIIDAWGNAWDTFQRTAANYATARSTCEGLGGRLPTPTEVYRVRANQTIVTAIGDSTSTSYLWTNMPDALADYMTNVRVSDGASQRLGITATTPYRCIWPTTKGDAFTGRSCYSAPADGCFSSGHLRMDRYDRAKVSAVAAFHECRFYGGRLAGTEDYLQLIHAGLPNGSQDYLWTSKAVTWYNDGRGYYMLRWNGTGTAAFTYQNKTYTTASVYYGNSFQPFRCVFTDEIR